MSTDPKKYYWPGKRILIVEDDEFSFQFFYLVFGKRGPEIIRAKDGREALELYGKGNIDLILMDIQIPVISGYDVTRQIRKLNPDIPIIAQTAFTQDGEEIKCLDAGCTAYLSKPISMSKLLDVVDHYLGE